MKFRTLILAVLFILLAGTIATAQWGTAKTLTVNVPFNFYVGETLMPAGEYQLMHNMQRHGFDMVALDKPAATKLAIQATDVKIEPGNVNRLVFIRENDRYMLHQIWSAGEGHVHDVMHAQAAYDIQVINGKPEMK